MTIEFNPTAGAEAGSDQIDQGTGQTDPQAQTQAQPAVRTFSQADVDRIVQDRLARERRQFERQAAPPQQRPIDPVEARIRPLESGLADIALDRTIARLGKQYPDFAANESAIVQRALDIVEANPQWAEHPRLLEIAYRDWQGDKLQTVDESAIEKRGVEKYLADKKAQAATAPRVEGKGGATPTTGSPKVNWKTADAVAMDFIKKQVPHRG